MIAKYTICAIVSCFLLFGCSGDDDGGGESITTAPLLIEPLNNSECLSGESISATSSKVNFRWNTTENATEYLLYVKNLLTNASMQYNPGANTSFEVTLLKNVPYSWHVSSRNTNGALTPSAEWQFYNAGDGVVNYAPFPVTLISPAMSSSIYGPSTKLEWDGVDLDNDILSYQVYMDANPNPTTLKSTTTSESIDNVAVLSNTTYYWKVKATDAGGNTSESPVFQFKVR